MSVTHQQRTDQRTGADYPPPLPWLHFPRWRHSDHLHVPRFFFLGFVLFLFFSICQPHEFHPSTWRHRPITTESSDENQPPQNFWKSDEKREKLLLRNFLESIFSFFGGKTRISHGDQVMVAFETKWVIDDSHLTTLNICKYLERALTAANLIHFKC